MTRPVTGLVLFGYATCHLLGHACGLFGLDVLDAVGRRVLLAPWRTVPGRWLLLACLLVHGGLGLASFVRRRHVVLPSIEGVQLVAGLLIPLLLLPHLATVRLGAALYGLDDSYHRILFGYWITAPLPGLSRQFALMALLWTHGCLGLHMMLRFRPWYGRWSGPLLGLAITLPVLAMLGLVNAGWDLRFRMLLEPGFAARHGPPAPGTPAAADAATLHTLARGLMAAYLGLLALAFAARLLLRRFGRSRGMIVIGYPGLTVKVPRGHSLLEASRFAGIDHVSMCGGRARCSTCRVRVVEGLAALPAPDAVERAALKRIGAPPDVRLACRVRPVADLAVVPLVPSARPAPGHGFAFQQGSEQMVTALAVDLRDSTRLAEEHLPYDTLYLVDRYVSAVTQAIERNGGYVTSVAGDGVMSVFGMAGSAAAGARNALRAAQDIWTGLVALDAELARDLRTDIRFGMGLHSGISIVGAVALTGRSSLQFLGDTGNVASRLEALTKEKRCVVIASAAVFDVADVQSDVRLRFDRVTLRGRDSVLPIYLFSDRLAFCGLMVAEAPA